MSGFQYQQPVSGSMGVIVEDEGVVKGLATILDFVGAGVTASAVVAGRSTITIPGATGSHVTLGVRNIFVSKQGDDATGVPGDLALDFLTIGAAILAAIAETPSASNKINIVVYPGDYSGETITLPNYVNLISALPPNFYYDGKAYSTTIAGFSGVAGNVYIGTINQSGNFSSIVGINCDSLVISADPNSGNLYAHIIASAISYTGGSGQDNGTYFDVHAGSFLPDTNLNGLYTYCTASEVSFASVAAGSAKNISGKMYNCIVDGDSAFASTNDLTLGFSGGVISGTLQNCLCNGTYSFASSRDVGGTISGTIKDCTAALEASFATGDQTGGTISGTIKDCIGADRSFACGDAGGTISGTIKNCTAINTSSGQSFASGVGGNGGTISGLMEGCNADTNSYASSLLANGGVISGTINNCIASGAISFASGENLGGTITGTLNNCISRANISFASSHVANGAGSPGILAGAVLSGCIANGNTAFASVNGTSDGVTTTEISGILNNCICTGSLSFASVLTNAAGTISGKINNCIGGLYSYASSKDGVGGTITSAGKLINCIGDNFSFTSCDTGNAGNIAGRLEGCIAEDYCFASSNSANGAIISGYLLNCKAQCYCFSSSNTGAASNISGTMINCVGNIVCFASTYVGTASGNISGFMRDCSAVDAAFSSHLGLAGRISGTLKNCDPGSSIAFRYSVLSGKMFNCRSFPSSFNPGTGLNVVDGALIEYCDIKGQGTFALLAPLLGAINIDARHSNFFGTGTDPLITILTAVPYNTNDANSIF